MSEQIQEFIELIFSGSIRGIDNIQQKRDNAIEDAMRISIPRALRRFISTVARDTGAMRSGVEATGQGADLEQIIVNVDRTNQGWVIRQQSVYNAMIDNDVKIKWHAEESPDFNPAFAGGYKNPTTPGTKPISLEEIMLEISNDLSREIPKQLRQQGLEAR